MFDEQLQLAEQGIDSKTLAEGTLQPSSNFPQGTRSQAILHLPLC